MSWAKIKKWYQSLSVTTRKRVMFIVIASTVIAFVQGLMDSVDFKIKTYGCKYNTFWDYHPGRYVPCEILRNRNPPPPPVKKRRR